jgi:hypothetical protein
LSSTLDTELLTLPPEGAVNENYRELKGRIRKLDELLVARGTGNTQFAQALSAVRRAAKHGNRSRDPSPELRALLDKAEILSGTRAG